MSTVKQHESFWYEVVIPDPSNLSGQFVASIIVFVASLLGIKNIVLDDLSGANISQLSERHSSKVVELKDVIYLIRNAVQFDWGNFLLFAEIGFVPDKAQYYPEFIAKTTVTLRAVDDSDMYVYTQSEKLVKEIKARYKGVSVSKGELDSFVYPE